MKKIKKNTQIKYETEEQKEIKKFIYVVIGLVIIILGIYLFTRAFITKDLFKDNKSDIEYTEGTINDSVAIVGTMLNRPYDEYYLMAFDSENTKANYYNALVSKYTSNEKSLKVYHIDLANKLNEKYIANKDEKATTKFTTIAELKLGDITLIKVKNKKVTKIITNIDEIAKELTVES